MTEENSKKVFFIITKDPSRVQGKTEAHYVSKFFAENNLLHIFAPLSKKIDRAVNHSLPLDGIAGVLLLNVLLIPYWIYQFVKERPDIVYCYQNVITPPILGRYIFGTTVVFDLQSDPYGQAHEFSHEENKGLIFKIFIFINKYLHLFTLRRSDYIFTLSDPLADSVVNNYGIDRDKIRIMPLGVDTQRFKPVKESYDRISIVYIGSLAQYRGIDTLLEAAGGLPPEVQEKTRVDLFGGGPREYLEKHIADATKDNHLEVYWHGCIPHEQIPYETGKSDIAVSPLPPFEAYQVSSPSKLFEYLALGLPIVASRITPHERILNENEDALLFEPESSEDLRQKLLKLIKDDDLRKKMAKSARSNGLQCSWEQRFTVLTNTLKLPGPTTTGNAPPDSID